MCNFILLKYIKVFRLKKNIFNLLIVIRAYKVHIKNKIKLHTNLDSILTWIFEGKTIGPGLVCDFLLR